MFRVRTPFPRPMLLLLWTFLASASMAGVVSSPLGFPAATLHAQSDGGLQDFGQAFKRLVKKVRPQVVGVRVYESIPDAGVGAPGTTVVPVERRVNRVTVSGVLWSSKGEVVTLLPDGFPEPEAKGGKIRIEVQFHDETRLSARRVSTDDVTGITLLMVEGKTRGFKAVKATGDAVEAGDLVVALGGVGAEPSLGFVRSSGRVVTGGGAVLCPRAIVTDIPAYPGHVGGPLYNRDGRLIGLLAFETHDHGSIDDADPPGLHGSRVGGRVRVASGHAMAYPADLLVHVVNQLRGPARRMVRGQLGAQFRRLEIHLLSGQRTVLKVDWIDEKGPAYAAGLRTGHLIVQVDEHAITKGSDLYWFVERVQFGRIGQKIAIKYAHCTDGSIGTIHHSEVEIVADRPYAPED